MGRGGRRKEGGRGEGECLFGWLVVWSGLIIDVLFVLVCFVLFVCFSFFFFVFFFCFSCFVLRFLFGDTN